MITPDPARVSGQALYQDWSTLDKFQRTRGVLRLMSTVIHSLWNGDDPAPLIMPGGIPLDDDAVASEIAQYLEDRFKPVIDADIDGPASTPVRIDASRPVLQARRVTRRIARTIFLGSAPTLKAAHKGIEKPHIWLGIATPGDTVGNFANALSLLSDQTTYLYDEATRYWYATQASVARMARERADRLRERPWQVHEEILRRLRESDAKEAREAARVASSRTAFARVQIGPERSDEIPDESAVRLVILHPQFRHTRGDLHSPAGHFAKMATEGRGTAHRLNRNMVAFLAADLRDADLLDDAVRQYLAWEDLAGSDEKIRDLDLPHQQATQARKRLAEADDTVERRISGAYRWLLVPVQSVGTPLAIDEIRADTTKDKLAERAADKLRNVDMLRVVHGPQNIRLNLDQALSSVWSAGHVQVGKLSEYYCQYPYLPRLANRTVLDDGITAVFNSLTWDVDGFAVASGYDEATGQYAGLAIPAENVPPQLTDTTLLVRPDRATAQRERERAAQEAARAAAAEAETRARAAAAASGGAATDPGGTATEPGVVAPGAAAAAGATAQGGSVTGGITATGGVATPGATAVPGSSTPPPPALKNTRFYGTVRLDPERFGRDLNRLYQEVIQHLAAPDGVELEISVEIHASKKGGFPDTTARIVSENARTLKFDQSGFEDN
jgi:hypothetical protein